MKQRIPYLLGLFLILSIFTCQGRVNKTSLLHQVNSLMHEFPDSAPVLLKPIITVPGKLCGSNHYISDTTKVTETALLTDQDEIELYRQKLAGRYKVELLSLLLLFIIGVLIFLWVDKRRKKKYLELQNLLMKTCTNGFPGNCEELDNTDYNFREKLKPSLELCLQLFYQTESYEKILSLEKKMGIATSLSIQEGQLICESIYETFGDILLKLKIQYTDLTKEDLLYWVFLLLGCSKATILLCTRASEGAFKSRKSRIKDKLGNDFYVWVSTRQCLVP